MCHNVVVKKNLQPQVRDVAGVRTYCLSGGSGAPVVFLHGLGASSYSWRHVAPPLARRRAVWAPDLPGFGRSDKPEGFDYSFAGFARWLGAFLDDLGLADADLVGNSMGAGVALRYALEHPGRVRRLALIGAPFYVNNRPRLMWTMRWPGVGWLAERLLGRWAVGLVGRTAFADPSKMPPDMVEEYAIALGERGGRRAVVSFLRRAIPSDAQRWMAAYVGLQPQTLVIRGEADGILDLESAQRFCREAPRARLLALKGTGHAPQEETPELVAPALEEFLG